MKLTTMLLVAVLGAGPAAAQDAGWGDLDALLVRNLSNTGSIDASFWLPDYGNQTQARRALGIAYIYIPGSAGSTSISAGIFMRQASGWVLTARVPALFGQSPRDHVFAPGVMEVTTTTLAPGDARCCPTKPTRWRVDLSTGQASPLN